MKKTKFIGVLIFFFIYGQYDVSSKDILNTFRINSMLHGVLDNSINPNDTVSDLSLQNPDDFLNITELIKKYNYPAEEYTLLTKDGYKLKVFRIPADGPVVFLMHGLICSSDDFITPGVKAGLAFLLAQKGYDVWMGNARGNKHSRDNIYVKPSEKEFWNFSFHEMGIIDLPAMVDFVLDKTGKDKLIYVGHSQGTTIFYIMCSLLPEYNEKISVMVSLSAVAFMSHIRSPLRYIAPFNEELLAIFYSLGVYELLSETPTIQAFQNTFCNTNPRAFTFCEKIIFFLGGFNYEQTNFEHLTVVFHHFPAGSSAKQLVHFAQLILSGYFRQYDYGPKNYEKYGSIIPPSYPVGKITAPVAVFYGIGDWLSESVDVKKLTSKLPNLIELYTVENENWSHFDFVYARDIKTLILPKLLSLIEKYV
ncbi:unnamed protein product [Leptosia nina]|uniref:Lipase n=1 Tax=Leptosia nina TaxID=320188 RepID=A0AAV1JE96_9NEOP